MLKSQRWISPAVFVLASALGIGTAQAANIVASETLADIATLVGTQFDVTPFTATNGLEASDGSGAFVANQPGTGGQAVVALREGPGVPELSDWLHLVWTVSGNTVTMTAHWRSDADPGGLPPLPVGVTPTVMVETGLVQDVTFALSASALESGFTFPSNLTVQVQSDAPEAVPEPATLTLTGLGLLGVATRYRRRRSSSNS